MGVSTHIVRRITGTIFGTCGLLALVGLWLPLEVGANRMAVDIAASVAIAVGALIFLLPWRSWPSAVTHALVPLGFGLLGTAVFFAGDHAYLFGTMFCACFAAIGLSTGPGTSLLAFPLMIAAYGVPLAFQTEDLALSFSLAAFVGILCVLVAETVAWISASFRRSRAALHSAHAAMDDMSADLTSTDVAELAWSASVRLRWLLGVRDVDVYSLGQDGRLSRLAGMVDGRPAPEDAPARHELGSWAAGTSAAKTHKAVIEGARGSSLTIPLVAGDRVVGLVEAARSIPAETITREQLDVSLSVCRLIALSIQNAEALAKQEAQTRRLASLLESSRAVAGADDMEEALAILTRRAGEAIGAGECVAYEYMNAIDAIVPRGMWEKYPTGWNKLGQVFPLAEHPIERKVLQEGMPILENLSDPNLDLVSREIMTAWEEKSCLTVPMRSSEGPVGLLVFWDQHQERQYTPDEMAFALGLADLAGESVRRARLVRTLQQLSGTDSLTGLANHRQIHELLSREQARAERHGLSFSLVMLDVDGFKLLNDTYGHPCGDTALRHIASVLQANARASDVAGRYGGDEFVLILPETSVEEAHMVIEKIRTAISEKPFVTPTGERIPLHASFGIASYPHDGQAVNELVVAADANLYVSKRRGGNNVTSSGRAEPQWTGETSFGMLESMVTAVDNKDRYTRHHSEQVTELALALTAALGLSGSSMRAIRAGGLLHDVGKIAIPDRILWKPGQLTPDEWAIVRGHPSTGEALIRNMPGLDEVPELIAAHHERFDGKGYPKGLAGADIPLLARILAVADAYSAMISDRPYRRALTKEEALAELRREAGTHFDPGVVAAFIQYVGGQEHSTPIEPARSSRSG